MNQKSATETSEEEVYCSLEKVFGAKDLERDPKVNGNKADFLVKSIDTYIEVHAIKDIARDLIEVVSQTKNVTLVELKNKGEDKIRDRIAGKILHECTQLPYGKANLLFTKTEGNFVSSDDVIDALIGPPHVVVSNNMETQVKYGRTAFRTEEEHEEVLHKLSAVMAYDRVCEHGKLKGILGNNEENAKIPIPKNVLAIFKSMLCEKC
jgi:hypothetical protein